MKLEKTISKYNMISEGDHVLCALSGGADSVALTYWLAKNAKMLNITVSAAHFSHGIRKDMAESEKNLCAELCSGLMIDFYHGEGDSIAYAKEHKSGLEEAARELRYNFLNSIADKCGANRIATAHHVDDNIETVIMNACRGAGVAGLIGIPPIRENIIRPLIEVSKKDVLIYVENKGLNYVTDLTNFEPCCRRNEIRLNLLPCIRERHPYVDDLLTRFSYQAYLKNCEINCKAQKLVSDCNLNDNLVKISIETLKNLEESVEARVIQLLHKKSGGHSMLSSRHIDSVRGIIDGSNPSSMVNLPEIVIKREYDDLIFTKPVLNPTELPKIIKIEQSATFGLWEVELKEGKHSDAFWIDRTKLFECLTLRARKEGDIIHFRGHSKSLKKLMIEKKIPKDQRQYYPVLVNGEDIVAVAGLGVNSNYKSETEENTVSVIFRRIDL